MGQLEAEGFYPVQGNRWKKGDQLYLPLYEGKMVQAFDHRTASVVINPENLNRPAQPLESTLKEHMPTLTSYLRRQRSGCRLPKYHWVPAINGLDSCYRRHYGAYQCPHNSCRYPSVVRRQLYHSDLRPGNQDFSALDAACLQSQCELLLRLSRPGRRCKARP